VNCPKCNTLMHQISSKAEADALKVEFPPHVKLPTEPTWTCPNCWYTEPVKLPGVTPTPLPAPPPLDALPSIPGFTDILDKSGDLSPTERLYAGNVALAEVKDANSMRRALPPDVRPMAILVGKAQALATLNDVEQGKLIPADCAAVAAEYGPPQPTQPTELPPFEAVDQAVVLTDAEKREVHRICHDLFNYLLQVRDRSPAGMEGGAILVAVMAELLAVQPDAFAVKNPTMPRIAYPPPD
jgi:hypothetical protein